MKKFLIGCVTAAMMMTPVAAKAGNDWVGPAILGTVVGIIIGSNNHGHSNQTVIVQRSHRGSHGHRAHRAHRGHRGHYRWVEVCKTWPRTIQDYYGDYYTEMVYDCRMVKKARW